MNLHEFLNAFNDKGLEPCYIKSKSMIREPMEFTNSDKPKIFHGSGGVKIGDIDDMGYIFSEIANIATLDFNSVIGTTLTIGLGPSSDDPFQDLYDLIISNKPKRFARLPDIVGGIVSCQFFETKFISVRLITFIHTGGDQYNFMTEKMQDTSASMMTRLDVMYAV